MAVPAAPLVAHAPVGPADQKDYRSIGQKDYRFFGADRTALATVRDLLREMDGSRCFCCDSAIRGEPVVDHFVPWARYPLGLDPRWRAVLLV